MDHLPSFNHSLSFLSSLAHDLQPQALALCKALSPKPTCIISDICLPWTLHIASHIGVPWLSFNGGSCFGNVAMSKILGSGICETVASDGEYFEVPGLEHRIENIDQLPSINHSIPFLSSLAHEIQPQALALCKALSPKPTCIISDVGLPWTLHIASHIGVPWVSFNGSSCFGNVAMSKIFGSGICESVESDGEYFVVPELEHRIEVCKAQLPNGYMNDGMIKFIKMMGEAERKSYGM
ncbi:UDP-glycosyltransferase 73C4, partial [Cucurbita argyrosperma subsp. argyrosperma]